MTELHSPPAASVPWANGLALTVPFAAVLAWSIGLYGYLDLPNIIASVVALVFPLLCLGHVARHWRSDPGLQLQTALVLAWFTWNVLMVLLHPQRLAIGLAWMGIEFAGLSIFLAVATARLDPELGFMIAGVASACSLGASFAGCLASDSPVFGMGNANYLMSACTPTLLGATVLIGHRLRHGRRPSLVVIAVIALGMATLVAAVIFTPFVRRGPVAAAAAVVAVLAVVRIYRRWPWLAVGLVILGVVILGIETWRIMHLSLPPFRLDRVFLYRASLERIRETWLTGAGPYGGISFGDSAGETARQWVSTGHWTIHAHNELLDAFLRGGLLSGILWLACTAAAMVRIARIEDAGERVACIALMTALMVHAMTDNSYAVQAPRLMYYSSLGLIFLCPARPRLRTGALMGWVDARVASLPMPRAIAMLGVVGGLLVAACELPGALTLCHAEPRRYLTDMRCAVLPENIDAEFEACFTRLLTDRKYGTAKEVLDLGISRLGMMGPFLMARVALAQQHLEHVEQDAQLWNAQTPEGHALEVHEVVDAYSQGLLGHPFSLYDYDQLSLILDRHPEGVQWVAPPVLTRLGFIAGHAAATLAEMPVQARTMDEAADLYARLIWWQRHQQPMGEVEDRLVDLVCRYGDNANIAKLGLVLAASTPTSAVTRARLLAPLTLGLIYYTPPSQQADLITRAAHDAAQHATVSDLSMLVASIYPAYWSDFSTHSQHITEEDPALRDACIQLFVQAEHAGGPAH